MRSARPYLAFAALALLIWIPACADRGSTALAPPTSLFGASLQKPDAATHGTAVIHVVVPVHPATTNGPAYVSPATQGIGVTVTSGKTKTALFFPLTSTEKYCKGGTSTAPLACKLEASVPAGDDTFVVDAYAGTKHTAPILASGTIVAKIRPGGTSTLHIAMGGAIAFLQVALANPFPAAGASATIPVNVTAADAWGYLIIGTYDKAIDVSDSDKSGVTKLSATTLANSAAAAKLTLIYSGKALAKPATVKLSIGTATKPRPAAATIDPGGSGIVPAPGLMITSYGSDAAPVNLSGPGTVGPYALSTAEDASHDPSCSGFVTVSQAGNDFAVAATGHLGACWLAASDSTGHQSSVPVLVSAFDWGYTTPAVTPPPLPTSAPFTTSTNAPLPAVTPPPAGQTPQPVPVPVPSTSAFSGTFALPIANTSSIPAGTSAGTTLTNVAPASLPVLLRTRWDVRAPRDDAAFNVLVYLEVLFSNGFSTSNQPPISFTLPSDDIVDGAYYYVALYDTTQPQLGWQTGFEGPGVVNGNTVTFTGNGSTFYFAQWQPYFFAVYAQSIVQPTPTPPPPPPTPTPSPTPGASPSPTPTPGFVVTPASISLNATGATQTFSPSGTAPYYVYTSDPAVAALSPTSGSGPFTVTGGVAGTATITVVDSSGKTAFFTVTVTTTTIPVH